MNAFSTSDEFAKQKAEVFLTETRVAPNGYIYIRTTLNGQLHAGPFGEPSAAAYDADMNPLHRTWHAYGKQHRSTGPARIVYWENSDTPKTEVYEQDGQPRPPDQGPWRIRFRRDGTVWQEENATGPDHTSIDPSVDLDT